MDKALTLGAHLVAGHTCCTARCAGAGAVATRHLTFEANRFDWDLTAQRAGVE